MAVEPMDSVRLRTNRYAYDFTWAIPWIRKLLARESYVLLSRPFEWRSYSQVHARLKLSMSDGTIYASLTSMMAEQPPTLSPIPTVFYVIRGQEGREHTVRSFSYQFPTRFNLALNFRKEIFCKGMLLHEYDARNDPFDCLEIEVYVEPPDAARAACSWDGHLRWTMDRFEWRRQAELNLFVETQESSYFYTRFKGHRVQVHLTLRAFGDEEDAWKLEVFFLTGEWDAVLPPTIPPHSTTVTLRNPVDPNISVTDTHVENKAIEGGYERFKLASVQRLVANDSVLISVAIELFDHNNSN